MNVNATDLMAAVKAQGRDDINSIYEAIEKDEWVLEHYDEIPFLETPLHVAASLGYIQFATEIMRLKPSLAWKLNKQGWSPIHLAMQNGHRPMVYRFVEIDKDLIRIKGKEGKTPLHVAAQNGETDLIPNFLWACPASINDVTVQSQTALHIAVMNHQYDALLVLVRWLSNNWEKDSLKLEGRILNWKDDGGNTILHIAAIQNDLEPEARADAVRTLSRTRKMNLNAKNISNLTTLDMASGAIREILLGAGATTGQQVVDTPTFENLLKEKIAFRDKMFIIGVRSTNVLTESRRNALLVVISLVITAVYQSTLSPPGGVYQASAGDNNATQGKVGTSIMSVTSFHLFSLFSLGSLTFSILIISVIPPDNITKFLIITIIVESYFFNMIVISPTSATRNLNLSMAICFLFCHLGWILLDNLKF